MPFTCVAWPVAPTQKRRFSFVYGMESPDRAWCTRITQRSGDPMPEDERYTEILPERRSRPGKRVIVFIDENPHTCDRVACRLEADGYHVLTVVNLFQGLELVKARTPDAVVWTDGVGGDLRWTVCHFVRSQLPPQTRAILRCGGPTADRGSEANAGYLGVAPVHESSDPDQLATALNELFGGRPTARRCPRAQSKQT